MASDLNNINIIGRLTKDAELKFTKSGFQITTMSLASNRSVKNGDQWEDQASFFDLKLLGKRGESLINYLQKGTQLAVTGQLVQERWEQEGQKRSKVIIQIDNIQLLGGNKSEGNNKPQQNNVKPSYQQSQQGGNGNFEDDIPF